MKTVVLKKKTEREEKAKNLRGKLIKLIGDTNCGHLGGSLSIVEILVSLYYKYMKFDPQRPDNPESDTLILSKGHASSILYLILADMGFFKKEELYNYGHPYSILQSHPNLNTPGVKFPSGSLGQGLSGALGLALAHKRLNRDAIIYTILGDGELNEGQIWEAVMAIAHYQLDNIIALVDANGIQLDGRVDNIMKMPALDQLFAHYGWYSQTIDGHNFTEIDEALGNSLFKKERPSVIICKTIKGKGISFMEDSIDFHGGFDNNDHYNCALDEVGNYSLE